MLTDIRKSFLDGGQFYSPEKSDDKCPRPHMRRVYIRSGMMYSSDGFVAGMGATDLPDMTLEGQALKKALVGITKPVDVEVLGDGISIKGKFIPYDEPEYHKDFSDQIKDILNSVYKRGDDKVFLVNTAELLNALEQCRVIAKQGNDGVQLVFGDKLMIYSHAEEVGTSRCYVSYSGGGVDLAVNVDFLIKALKGRGELVYISVKKANEPICIDKNIIIMPLFIQGTVDYIPMITISIPEVVYV